MEPVSAVFGIMAALPQCIQSAKELYDLRGRYKDASVLITAIYSESMVIAASLSQVQNLLQHDSLVQKPQLLETFDRALTGCRVVYGCLEEEVRDLVEKSQRNDLRFKDRARYLLKEDTFKELLTQIRGQQSALSLLIQGLQMESMADIRKLVEDNSSKLDQVVKRSKTLRQSHPRIEVPESIFSCDSGAADASDAESIVKSTHFEFDDQVISSKAYRGAMARYTMYGDMADVKEPEAAEIQVAEEDSTQVGTIQGPELKRNPVIAARSQQLIAHFASESEEELPVGLPRPTQEESPPKKEEMDALDSVEREMLPYMPRTTSTAPYLTPVRADTFDTIDTKADTKLAPAPLRSFSEGSPIVPEATPPLPPRRTSGSQLRSQDSAATLKKERSKSSGESLDASDAGSIMSRVSEASSYTAYEPMPQSQTISIRPMRKPLPLAHKASHTVEPQNILSAFESSEMHAVWLLLVEAERNFFDRMTRLRKMFYDNIIRQWPVLEQHLGVVLIAEQLAATNKKFLWLPMEQQLLESDQAICDPVIFETWTTNVQRMFREYCQALPHATGALRATQNSDGRFTPFVNTLGLSIAYFGKSWEDYLKLPVTELDLYVESTKSLISIATESKHPDAGAEAQQLMRALYALDWLKSVSTTVLEESQSREDVQNLERRIHTLDTDILSQLRLLDTSRRVRYQSGMTMKLKSKGPWHAVHVVLLDNYLFWGKVKAQKKAIGDKVVVLDAPIPINELDVSLPCDEHQFQKATMFDEVPRNSIQYIIMVKRKDTEGRAHMLGLPTYQERRAWMDHFEATLDTTILQK
ncbi:hypothetical protein BU25DRAFT_413944 [Macroventuria anomochaeta]|uniref:Uncharacterized protein n=1 Tax=Macroventuria anomochaeta TaxID=301207 RepID=A0ACB6RQ88_9PLEO|nr:uncharacterized protein BU25DRAFT_413944 [Macroventuria anomochaeta]KAF2624071.1 hypothetical protein BU25DRAFT_413944 [Macroventuria anomochaeta]